MNRTDLHKRLERLGRRYQPAPELPQVAISVICVVPWTDPRCGTWQERDDNPAPFLRSTDFYCRGLRHFNEMMAEYHEQEGGPK